MKKIILSANLNRKIILSKIFYCLFIVFAAIAFINPKWGESYPAQDYRRGIDIVFAIDVSRSMDIRDIKEVSRLERGLAVVKESAESLQDARFAAAIGRGAGYLSVPLTYDNEAILNFLESLDSRMVTGRSTNLQSLIEASQTAFHQASAARKVIVLVSDGEAHFGVLRNAINNCIRDNIAVITVGTGSDEGAPVPGIEEEPAPISSRDAQTLRMIAERTGGIYIDGNREDSGAFLSSHLSSLSQGVSSSNRQSAPKERRGLFAILAGILFSLSKFILRTRTNKRAAAIAASVFVLLCSCSEGKLLLIEANYLFSRGRYDEAVVPYHKALEHEDAAPYAEYGLGLAYQTMDESTAALRHYAISQEKTKNLPVNEHRELAYRNYYNSGIIFFEEGDYTAAAAAFKEALKADPSKIDAKRNLEISLMVIAQDTSRNRQQEVHNETKELLFEIIQEQEQKNWKSSEWTEENFLGPDY